MLKQILFFSSLLLMHVCMAQVNIIPQPEQVTMPATAGNFTITSSTVIVANGVTKQIWLAKGLANQKAEGQAGRVFNPPGRVGNPPYTTRRSRFDELLQ